MRTIIITIDQNQRADLWHDFWLVVTFLLPMIMSIRSCEQDTIVYHDSCIYSSRIRSYMYNNSQHSYRHRHRHTHTQTLTVSHTDTDTHTDTHTDIDIHTHTHTHIHTHTHTHTHTLQQSGTYVYAEYIIGRVGVVTFKK